MKTDRKIRSDCPISMTLDLVGDRWSLLIIRDLLKGKHRYGEFLGSDEGIPTNILANRLKSLEADGLIARRQYSERPPRFEYELTEKGSKLRDLVVFIRDWGAENLTISDERTDR